MMRSRTAYGLGALVRIALLGYADYLQHVEPLAPLGYAYSLQCVEHREPCPLCMVQRAFFYAVLALFVLAAIHAPHGWGARVYSGLITLFALGGAAAAGRQVWLQHLPPDKVPQCGPDLFFMLENFPLARTL